MKVGKNFDLKTNRKPTDVGRIALKRENSQAKNGRKNKTSEMVTPKRTEPVNKIITLI